MAAGWQRVTDLVDNLTFGNPGTRLLVGIDALCRARNWRPGEGHCDFTGVERTQALAEGPGLGPRRLALELADHIGQCVDSRLTVHSRIHCLGIEKLATISAEAL